MKSAMTKYWQVPVLALAAIFSAISVPSVLAQENAPAKERPNIIVKTGNFTEDVVVAGKDVTVQANVDGGVIAMGSEVEIRSTVSGDIVAMGGRLNVGDAVDGDAFLVGGAITASGQIGGELTATGGNVESNVEVTGNALIMGGNIEVENRVAGDLKMIGGNVETKAAVTGNLWMAGGRVEFDDVANVQGNAWIVGGRVEVEGRVEGNLRAAGRKIEISGEVLGDVHIDGIEVEITRTAVFHGNLFYRSPDPARIHPDAKIRGDVSFEQSAAPKEAAGAIFAAVGSGLVITLLAFIVLGAIQMLVLPEFSLAAARVGLTEPWKALGIGISFLIVTPFVIVLLVPTLVGLPLAVVLAAIYVVLLALGLIISALIVGRKGLAFLGKNWDGSVWRRIGLIALGLVAMTVVAAIPFLGIVILIAALSIGAGSLIIQIARRRAPVMATLATE